MIEIRCEHCGKIKVTNIYLQDYAFKKRERGTGKMYYFCCYDCMQQSVRENPNRYGKRKWR